MTRYAFLGLAVAALLAGPVKAADDLKNQVTAMIQAARQMDYQGVLVHGMPVGVESMRFYHAGEDDGSYRERLVMLTGPARELVRNGEDVRRYHPEKGRVVVAPRRTGTGIFRLDAAELERVRAHYRLEQGPSGRIAGRESRAIEFRAGDSDRFTYRIWRDKATNLPLQTEVLDAEGRAQETFMFATVETGVPPQRSDLELGAPPEIRMVRRRRLEGEDRHEVLSSLELPAGFQLKARFQDADGDRGHQYFFSDGLATLSVFVNRTEGPPDSAGHKGKILQRGALHASSLSRGGYRITLLGELPGVAMRRIASSLEDAGGDSE
ncbi:MucB/RseB C-terminal domain-containing protein [Thiohalorhabdus sp.]|uniref:MucB/RseB C-terminal domain-containing protein n=1 Tax=Thiohalorhabdus sp. TaxID=3094134 RepID=UPI002FC3D195